MNILDVENLYLSFQKEKECIDVLQGVNFHIKENTTLALVGESGCGKTQTARCIMKLLTHNAILNKGSITYKGKDILRMQDSELQQIRGKQIAMIFQNPQAALNPVFTIEKQIKECIELYHKEKKYDYKSEVKRLLRSVKIGDEERVMRSYPFQLSLGMCQRIMIAMAIASEAQLWIVDEATSALDVNVQADILDLLNNLKRERNLSMLLITHDLRILPSMSDEIAIMLHGEIVEVMNSEQLLEEDAIHHPYTQTLLEAMSFEGSKMIRDEVDNREGEGCLYASRCRCSKDICFNQKPGMKEISNRQSIQCHLGKN